jgi:hypothetical protein
MLLHDHCNEIHWFIRQILSGMTPRRHPFGIAGLAHFAKFVGFRINEIKLLLDGESGRPPPQRWRHIAEKKVEQVDTLITEAIAVRALLQATLQQKCPKLVERGLALARTAQKFDAPNPRLTR